MAKRVTQKELGKIWALSRLVNRIKTLKDDVKQRIYKGANVQKGPFEANLWSQYRETLRKKDVIEMLQKEFGISEHHAKCLIGNVATKTESNCIRVVSNPKPNVKRLSKAELVELVS